jgi:hypothetical protein
MQFILSAFRLFVLHMISFPEPNTWFFQVLQLAGNRQGACRVPIRTQASQPGWRIASSAAAPGTTEPSVLPLMKV